MTSVDASPPRVRRHGARASGPTRARGGLAATMMMAGRSRGVPSRPAKDGAGTAKTEDLEDFLQRRDWVGATTLLEHRRSFPGPDGEGSSSTTLEWLAYAHFHAGNPHKALELYRALAYGASPRSADAVEPALHPDWMIGNSKPMQAVWAVWPSAVSMPKDLPK